MLDILYQKGYLNISKIISENAKILGLNAEEAFVLNKILDNYSCSNNLSIDELQNQVLITSNRIDKVVAALMERGYYEVYLSYDKGKGKECISFKPLFSKLEDILTNSIQLDKYDIEKANKYLSAKLNRVLTSSELEILQGFMIDDHYTYDEIVAVIDEISNSKRVLSMRTITMGLANNKQKVNVTKEAPQSLKDFYNRI